MNHLKEHSPGIRKRLLREDHKSALALLRSGRFWGWFALAWLPSLVAMGYQVWTDYEAMPVTLGFFLSAGFTAVLVQSLLRRRAITNKGIYQQESEPFRYWLANILTVLAIGLIIVAILRF
jgi:hypothetical protein